MYIFIQAIVNMFAKVLLHPHCLCVRFKLRTRSNEKGLSKNNHICRLEVHLGSNHPSCLRCLALKFSTTSNKAFAPFLGGALSAADSF